jgi:hypothetical protein
MANKTYPDKDNLLEEMNNPTHLRKLTDVCVEPVVVDGYIADAGNSVAINKDWPYGTSAGQVCVEVGEQYNGAIGAVNVAIDATWPVGTTADQVCVDKGEQYNVDAERNVAIDARLPVGAAYQVCVDKGGQYNNATSNVAIDARLPVGAVGQVCVEKGEQYDAAAASNVAIDASLPVGAAGQVCVNLLEKKIVDEGATVGENGDVCHPPVKLFGTYEVDPKDLEYSVYGLGAGAIIGWLGWALTQCRFSLYKAHYIAQVEEVLELAQNNAPIVISLREGAEIKLTSLEDSSTYFKYDGTHPVKTSWISDKDALLVYDHDGSKAVNDGSKIVFTTWAPNAKSDFEAFLTAVDKDGNKLFDSNGDGIFDRSDEKFDQFYLWQDKNVNGAVDDGELTSLAEAGLLSIDFNAQASSDVEGVGHTANVNWACGAITTAGDAVFVSEVPESAPLLE